MSEACGVPYDVLAWTAEWYVREDTPREANTVIVNHHHGLELAGVFGGGAMSSSDGQRFPVRGKSTTARDTVIHGGQVLSTYTHVSDQHSTYGTKVLIPTQREAQFVLDDLLGNATDLPIQVHATDTHGVTLINFALFDLVGKQLSPGSGTWERSPWSGTTPRPRSPAGTRTPGPCCRPAGMPIWSPTAGVTCCGWPAR
jgi:TnpA family transposase